MDPLKHLARLQNALAALKPFVVSVVHNFALLEIFLGVLLGAFIGAAIGDDKGNWWLWIVVAILVGVYYPLARLKVHAQWLLPTSLFDNLEASSLLRGVEKELGRKKGIDLLVDTSIKELNAQTCSLTGPNGLCDEAVKDGLMGVLRPLIDRPQTVLDCEHSSFSVGVVVTYTPFANIDLADDLLRSFPVGSDMMTLYAMNLPENDPLLVFRDDLRIESEVPDNPIHLDRPTGFTLSFAQSIQTAMNESVLDVRQVTLHGKLVQLICSPIPVACDEHSTLGVIWFCGECTQEVPPDLENVLRIFGRIAANWIFRYNQCAEQRILTRLNSLAGSSSPTETLGTDSSSTQQVSQSPPSAS